MNKSLLMLACATSLIFGAINNVRADEVNITKELGLTPNQASNIYDINNNAMERLKLSIETFKAAKADFEETKKEYISQIEEILNPEQKIIFEKIKIENEDILIKKGGFKIDLDSLEKQEWDDDEEDFAVSVEYLKLRTKNPKAVNNDEIDED